MTLNETVDSTQTDSDLQTVISAFKTNRWDKSYENSVLDTFSRLCYELTLVPVNDSEILGTALSVKYLTNSSAN
jgi:hypothetical protein